MTWDSESMRHGLCRRGISNARSFGYRPNFVLVRVPGESHEMSNSQLSKFLTDPEAVEGIENKYLSIPAIGHTQESAVTDKSIEKMQDFEKNYWGKLKDSDIEPDFFLDLYGMEEYRGLSYVLYYISNGNADKLREHESIRSAIIVYMMTNADSKLFWERGDYEYIAVLTPQEKAILIPKLLKSVRSVGELHGMFRWESMVNNIFMLSTAGLDDSNYKLIKHFFEKFAEDNPDMMEYSDQLFGKADYPQNIELMDKYHDKTKVIYWKYYNDEFKRERVGYKVVADTDDIELYKEMNLFGAPSNLRGWTENHFNDEQAPRLVWREISEPNFRRKL